MDFIEKTLTRVSKGHMPNFLGLRKVIEIQNSFTNWKIPIENTVI